MSSSGHIRTSHPPPPSHTHTHTHTHTQGISPVLTLLKEGLISGSPDEKEEAARVLVEVIHLSSPKTLSTGKAVMTIAGPLIRVLGDRYGWNVKVATLKALVELVRKVMCQCHKTRYVLILMGQQEVISRWYL